jgi:hypothetical protein
MNDGAGRSVDQGTMPRQDDQVEIYPSVPCYLTKKGLFSNLLFQLNLFYTLARSEPGPTVDPFWAFTGTLQQGLIDGGSRFLEKEKQSFTFGSLFCGLEFLGAAWENGEHDVFSIVQLNRRKTNGPRAKSSYKIMGEAPWGRMHRLWR